MLSVKKLGLAQASTYYSRDNYYTQQVGEWRGKLKDELGLKDLTHENFSNMLKGISPDGETLGAARTKNSVPAFDLTFSANKSLSILYEIAVKEDPKLAQKLSEIHDNAVNKAFDYIEKNHIQTRTQKNKKQKIDKTGNMIIAKFQHDTSRSLDPQLHIHGVVMNLTKGTDGKFRTLDMSNLLKKNSKIVKNLGSYYRHHLKQELLNAGIEIEMTDTKQNFFELKSVNKDLINEFSKRRKMIEKEVEKLKKKFPNMSKSKLFQTATLNSRVAKKDINREEIREINVNLVKKYINHKKLIQEIKEEMKKEKNTKISDEKTIKKAIKKAEKNIKNKFHKTPDNIAMNALILLNNTSQNLEKVYEIVHKIKKKKEQIKEIKEEIKPLQTMHDVVLNQLKMTKLSSSFFKNVNKDESKNNEERLENARFKISNAKQNNSRYFEKYHRNPKSTNELVGRIKQQFEHLDRDAIARKARGWRGRDESQGFDVSADRNAGKNKREIKVTREDLKRDTKMVREHFSKKAQKNESEKEI